MVSKTLRNGFLLFLFLCFQTSVTFKDDNSILTKFERFSISYVTEDQLKSCVSCQQIADVISNYDFSEYYKKIAYNEVLYTNERKNSAVIQPEIAFFNCYSF